MAMLDINKTKALASFWIFGLCNNFGYVLMLSAAYDINKTDSESYCSRRTTGAILLADILPTLFIKLINPLFAHKIHYNIKVTACCVISAASLIMVASAHHYGLTIFGVVLASISSGFGEVTFLAMTSHFEKSVITSWSSGTGTAGILGASLYLLFTQFLTPSQTIYLMLIVPTAELLTYWLLLVRPATFNEGSDGFKPLLPEADSGGDNDSLQEASSPPPAVEYHPVVAALIKLLRNLKELSYYVFSLMLVYFSEYTINQGLFEVLCYGSFQLNMTKQYKIYQVLYQVGVTISRSSASLIHFRQVHIFSILQCVNLIIFALEARYAFIPSIYITFVLIFWEGLLGGACYVNAFYRIYQEVPHKDREYALGLVSCSDSTGITLAGIVSFPIHNAICQYRKSRAPPICFK